MTDAGDLRVPAYSAFYNRDRLIHILDTDPSTCEALSVLFRLEGFQTTFSTDTASFFAGLQRRLPDVVAINLVLGADDGIEVLRRVKSMRSGAIVFMLCDGAQVDLAVQAMRAGAYGVIVKPIDHELFFRQVTEALRQDVHLGTISEGGFQTVEVRGFSKLTPRERAVLQLVVNGNSNKEAALALGISPRTVEVHRARVMMKLGAKNTAHLIRIVLTG